MSFPSELGPTIREDIRRIAELFYTTSGIVAEHLCSAFRAGRLAPTA